MQVEKVMQLAVLVFTQKQNICVIRRQETFASHIHTATPLKSYQMTHAVDSRVFQQRIAGNINIFKKDDREAESKWSCWIQLLHNLFSW
ncbi:hypothetical protein O6P43_025593 [Quillaja saponaria]|uniref:Uncharacterized protein n=1 Tax=Quillaja saponaria TaxID=32244 RepID=A0AAD7LAW7_QUISA|nr:hypothetical protein O6P43_025593 [Quillaja saponaria]